MVHVHNESVIAAPQQFVFDYMGDFTNVPEWLFGITKLETISDIKQGLGAVYDGSMKLGPKTLHSVIKISRWEPPTAVETDHVSGFVFRSKWAVEAPSSESTRVIADIDYELPGGMAGRALGKIIEPFVAIAVRHSDETLRKKLEKMYQEIKKSA